MAIDAYVFLSALLSVEDDFGGYICLFDSFGLMQIKEKNVEILSLCFYLQPLGFFNYWKPKIKTNEKTSQVEHGWDLIMTLWITFRT